jgi:predicted amidophosphoribosyltransferase
MSHPDPNLIPPDAPDPRNPRDPRDPPEDAELSNATEGVASSPHARHHDDTHSRPARVLCPYCGLVQPVTARCAGCKGLLDPESRQATQNAMGPWFVRNPAAAHHPGCSYPTLRELVRRGKVTRETILRGPTTAQFWNMAANTPGVAVLLGECHACHQPAREDEYLCRHCGVVLTPRTDRQHLGLAPVRTVGVPVSQPPVVSSTPVSALSMPAAAVESEPASAFTNSAERSSPSSFAEAGVHAAPIAFGTEAVLAKRRAMDRRQRVVLVVGAVVLSIVALGAIGVIASRTAPKKAAPATTPSAPASPEAGTSPTAPQGTRPMTIGERFAEDLAEAARLTALGTTTDMESALRILEGVRTFAVAEPKQDKAFLAMLAATIEKLRSKLDDARLNEVLSGGGDVGTPAPK